VVETREGVLYVNPGSAGPRRFKLPIALGELTIDDERIEARIIELAVETTT
jgi:predicted phosphodiesterase